MIEVNDIDELADYGLCRTLLAQSPYSIYFQSLDWLTVYWRHQGEGCRLRVFVAQARGKTIGFLPLVVRNERTKVGQLRGAGNYPLHDWGSFYGPIGPNPTATLLAGLGHIGRTSRDWDVLDLRWIDEEMADRGRTMRGARGQGVVSVSRPMVPKRIDRSDSRRWLGIILGWSDYKMADKRSPQRTSACRDGRRQIRTLSAARLGLRRR